MKIFVYKTLFVFVCIFLLFQLTIGIKIKQANNELNKLKSKENIEKIKDKLRDELKNAVRRWFKEYDAGAYKSEYKG